MDFSGQSLLTSRLG